MEVKNCPFCDGEARLKYRYTHGTWCVECMQCGVNTKQYPSKEKAALAWNKRITPVDIRNKVVLFVDLDGTLAHWIPETTPEELIAPGYFRNLPAYTNMIDNVNYLIDAGFEVYTLSAWMPTLGNPVQEKNDWLTEHLPIVRQNHRLFCPCDKSKWQLARQYAKADKILVLIDDYSKNLHQWIEDGKGRGIGIKVLNGINGKKGSWKDFTISMDCKPKELERMLERCVNRIQEENK